MKRNSHQFTYVVARAVLAALIASFVLISAPAAAAKTSHEDRMSHEDRVEARITDMHTQLKITQEQEEQWGKVAQVMRDNAKSMDALTQARMEHTDTMTAVDDLKSYGEITDAHADGLKKLTPVFATLYEGMSDPQKKQADTVFRHGGHMMSGHHRMSRHHRIATPK